VRVSNSVIQTDNTVVLTYCDQSDDSCCHRAAHNFGSQANYNHVQGTRLKASLSYCGQQVIHVTSVNFIYLQFVVLPSSTSKSPFTVITHCTVATSCFRTRLRGIYGDGEDDI